MIKEEKDDDNILERLSPVKTQYSRQATPAPPRDHLSVATPAPPRDHLSVAVSAQVSAQSSMPGNIIICALYIFFYIVFTSVHD